MKPESKDKVASVILWILEAVGAFLCVVAALFAVFFIVASMGFKTGLDSLHRIRTDEDFHFDRDYLSMAPLDFLKTVFKWRGKESQAMEVSEEREWNDGYDRHEGEDIGSSEEPYSPDIPSESGDYREADRSSPQL